MGVLEKGELRELYEILKRIAKTIKEVFEK